ncbi:MAG: biopolymer transporter ExbD, partial [Planctomycetes bacterium]|nr:biopolymer transporter ExbD [Planctomycetota bacterium]
RKRYADQTVVVRADGEGPYQNVMDVVDVCRRAGVGVKLATRLKTEERE